MDESDLKLAVSRLKKALKDCPTPAVTVISLERDPFRVLTSCLLSLRTRDEVTAAASKRLFALADTPAKMSRLSREELARAIYPVAFYRNKAESLKSIAWTLLEKHGGRVPDTLEALLKLKGVGRKTANVVLGNAFAIPGMVVDTHVKRLAYRLGWSRSSEPEKVDSQKSR